jgi:hypothetical protein
MVNKDRKVRSEAGMVKAFCDAFFDIFYEDVIVMTLVLLIGKITTP